jgi:hypothetical protein
VLAELLVLALTVVRVADGDTLVVAEGEHKVTLRLAEIEGWPLIGKKSPNSDLDP